MHLTIALRVRCLSKVCTIEEEGKRKVNKAMLDETAVYEAVKEILACNKRNVEWLRCMNVGSYLDIKAFIQL